MATTAASLVDAGVGSRQRNAGRLGRARRVDAPSRATAMQVNAKKGKPFTAAGVLTENGGAHLKEAARLALLADGLTAPHPRCGCVLVGPDGKQVSSAFQMGQGATPAEVTAVRQAAGAAKGGVAFVNLEPRFGVHPVHGAVDGAEEEVQALLSSGVERVVVGLSHPVPGLRGSGVAALRAAGLHVDVMDYGAGLGDLGSEAQAAARACLEANEAVLHRAVTGKPLGILKYAMTLDGKIACASGHSAWVSNSASRALVFKERARSDAVIVGGNTVRKDGPRLTTRVDHGHAPIRVVLTRSFDLPYDAPLWDTTVAPTMVITQVGANPELKRYLKDKGVEVVELPFLSPQGATEYLTMRGCLQLFWECGGILAAPAVQHNCIHKTMAFIAPKLIGGENAQTPLNDMGFTKMTQALDLCEVKFQQVESDLLVTGYLPVSGGLEHLAKAAGCVGGVGLEPQTYLGAGVRPNVRQCRDNGADPAAAMDLHFYKAWDVFGALSNFAPFQISMPSGPSGTEEKWSTLEHYYQAYKFKGVEAAADTYDAVRNAPTPEAAALEGRRAQRGSPELVRQDWDVAKSEVMWDALNAKFRQNGGPRRLLLATAEMGMPYGETSLAESAPHDYVWGIGHDMSGSNLLGEMLVRLREDLLQEAREAEGAEAEAAKGD